MAPTRRSAARSVRARSRTARARPAAGLAAPGALVALGALVLALALSGCGGDDDELGNVFAVQPGTCFDSVTADAVRDLPIVDCAQEHANEVFAVVAYEDAGDDAPYPGAAALAEFATEQCQAALEGYVGRPYSQSSLEIAPLYPQEDGWTDADDRSIVCALFARDGEPLVGSVKNTGR
jgi:hypothetical protein